MRQRRPPANISFPLRNISSGLTLEGGTPGYFGVIMRVMGYKGFPAVAKQVFIQSNVLEVALNIKDHFDAESYKLIHINKIDHGVICNKDEWLLTNPMGIRTEREIHAKLEVAKIYRRMYQKQSIKSLIFKDSSYP
ncbi:hypothetical protein LguiA_033355 [Lonicera macranthoides]